MGQIIREYISMSKKNIIYQIILIIIFIIAGVGAWFFYQEAKKPIENINLAPANLNVNQARPLTVNEKQGLGIDPNINATIKIVPTNTSANAAVTIIEMENVNRPLDSDGDGLSDEEEKKLGTDPNNPDTDGDKLFDGQEITWGTDPKKADTDGDGYTDSQEIKAGYNPNGKGKL